MKPGWIDISRTLSAAIACWPGDVAYRFDLGVKISEGASCNVGSILTSVHTGTHVDSPFHFDPAGATIEALDPAIFIGPAWVVDVTGSLDRWLPAVESLDLSLAPRVLFRTGGWPEGSPFPEAIPVMEPELPGWLAERGVKLIGLDVPSVDPLDSKTLDLHHALGRCGIHILEGLTLETVPPGLYDLIALPLKLAGSDGSPVRAVIRAI
ncbi:arylformamidase [bacterium]|nr:arylformamidase [bacterium]